MYECMYYICMTASKTYIMHFIWKKFFNIYKQNKFRKEYLESMSFACECKHKYIDQKIDPNTMTITKNIN